MKSTLEIFRGSISFDPRVRTYDTTCMRNEREAHIVTSITHLNVFRGQPLLDVLRPLRVLLQELVLHELLGGRATHQQRAFLKIDSDNRVFQYNKRMNGQKPRAWVMYSDIKCQGVKISKVERKKMSRKTIFSDNKSTG